MSTIPIVYTTDSKYLSFALWAAKITARNSSHPLQILILCIDQVQSISKNERNSTINVISIQTELAAFLRKLPELTKTYAHITVATYLRLLLPDLLSNYEYCIYLDVDTLTLLDIKDLMDCADPAFLVQGVRRPYYHYLSHLGFGPDSIYINAGVLLMNLAAWRNSSIRALSFALIDEMRESLIHLDQDVLNIACAERIGCIDYKFNLHPLMPEPNVPPKFVELVNLELNGAIVHFYGEIKAWSGCFNLRWQQLYQRLAPEFTPKFEPEFFTKAEAALFLEKARDFALIGDSLGQRMCTDAASAILRRF